MKERAFATIYFPFFLFPPLAKKRDEAGQAGPGRPTAICGLCKTRSHEQRRTSRMGVNHGRVSNAGAFGKYHFGLAPSTNCAFLGLPELPSVQRLNPYEPVPSKDSLVLLFDALFRESGPRTSQDRPGPRSRYEYENNDAVWRSIFSTNFPRVCGGHECGHRNASAQVARTYIKAHKVVTHAFALIFGFYQKQTCQRRNANCFVCRIYGCENWACAVDGAHGRWRGTRFPRNRTRNHCFGTDGNRGWNGFFGQVGFFERASDYPIEDVRRGGGLSAAPQTRNSGSVALSARRPCALPANANARTCESFIERSFPSRASGMQ
jgi:hypothetical protein